MIAWSGIGMNYGHQPTAGYDTSVVESDFSYLTSVGINRVRIVFPPSGSSAIPNAQDMVARARAHGMYVIWGASTGASNGGLTATIWGTVKTYITGTLIPWAIANSLPELCLCNEADYEADGTTLTAATVQADVRTLATTAKNAGYTGIVSYSTAATLIASWFSGGIGSLDRIGFNSYDTLANFQSRAASIVADFGSKAYVSEFGCITNGFSDYNDESAWYTDVINRVSSLQSAGVGTGYFFCYRDGGFGLTANTFACMQTNNVPRSCRDAIKNVVAPAFSMIGV